MATGTLPAFARSNAVKTYDIELQRIKSMSHTPGQLEARIDASVQSQPARNGASSTLSLTVENARVLVLLLKAQIAEAEGRKPREPR